MTLPENAIAIVGISGRFPGADDVGQFWANTRRGVTSITRFCVPQPISVLPPGRRIASKTFSKPPYSQMALPFASYSRTTASPSCAARI